MMYLLHPRAWIAVVLLAVAIVSHTFAYRAGKAVVRAEWSLEKVAQTEARLRQEQAFRAREHELTKAKNESEARYVELKKRFDRAAAGARTELDGLRGALAARGRAAAQDPTSGARADGGALERQLLGQGAAALVDLAAEADRLAAQLIGLQAYVSNVCLAK